MRFNIFSILSFLSLCTLGTLSARENININRNWDFTPGWETSKSSSTRVTIPHMWNQDALSGDTKYFRGLGNYKKNLQVPAEWKESRLYLRFHGAANIANVFINGKHLAEHRGGYTAFTVDITDAVKYGAQNEIYVRVNNAPTLDIMPLVGDFNMYGGLYRDVELVRLDPVHISLDDHGSSGVYLSQETTAELSTIKAKVKLSASAGVKITLRDADGNIVATAESTQDKEEQQLQLQVQNPRLWNGRVDPHLYSARIDVLKDGKITDSLEESLGLRFFRLDPDKGFFLNGRPYQLRGVCRHQDRAEIGNALAPLHHEEDMEIMMEMGVNAIRLAHYPQDKYIYELCDRYGMVVWAEIPFIGPGGYRDKGFVDQPSFRENGKQQLIEMIRQNYNHPSICFWGIFNELNPYGDNPLEYLKELHALSRQEDPSRPTVCASNIDDAINHVTDAVAWNKYYGWYGGNPSDIGAWADSAHKRHPHRPIGISEYGAGGSIKHQQEKLEKAVATSYWHPENWQTHFHEEHWKAIAERPYIWGSFVWNMFDFGAAHRTEGEIDGKNDKGLVSFDRKHKKDSFYFYKANWNKDAPFVYIAERRLRERTQPKSRIKVYSNGKELELFLNGQSQGKRTPEYGTCIWELSLQSGENTLRAQDTSRPSISDSYETTLIHH